MHNNGKLIYAYRELVTYFSIRKQELGKDYTCISK